MIKIFHCDNPDLIEKEINDWEKNNKVKIDNITISPKGYYFNNNKSAIKDADFMIIINYHKRRIRKKDENGNNNEKH